MNYHSDKWINDHVWEHYNDALEHFPEDRIQKMQNDTKLMKILEVILCQKQRII